MRSILLTISNSAGATLAVVLLSVLTVAVLTISTRPALVFEYLTDKPANVQVFYDIGKGLKEAHSSLAAFVPKQGDWQVMRLDLPREKIHHLRLEPADRAGSFRIRNLQIVGSDGAIKLAIPPDTIRPAQQILSMEIRGPELEIETVSDAYDPILEIPVKGGIDLSRRRSWDIASVLPSVLIWVLVWGAILLICYHAPRLLARTALWNSFRLRPNVMVLAAAILGVTVTSAPVIFAGKSLLSVKYGTILFYDRCPTLPNYSECSFENVHESDVGAMAWSHFPLAVAQERAIKQFGEFPLWNRFNSAGTTMIGQGQTMLGDPLNWLTWLTGVEAVTFDIKFLILRIVFAASLGMAVFVVTRSAVASVALAFFAPFVGYFMMRINHPAAFTLCYSPLISLAWLKVIFGENEASRLRWLGGLMLANWLVLNSGTVKEAYMSIIVLNAIGAVHFVVECSRFTTKLKAWLALLAAAGVCFVMIASPVWSTLLDAIRAGGTQYDAPAAWQFPPWLFLGFVDNAFYLSGINNYFPAVNALLFSGTVAGIACATRMERPEARRSAIVLALGCGALFAIAFGVVPEKWLVAVPFVKNIHHVNNIFSTILIIPISILAGIGFGHLDAQTDPKKRRQLALLTAAVFLALVILYVYSFTGIGGRTLRQIIFYSAVVLGSAVIAPWLILRLMRGRLSYVGIGACLIVTLLVVGRGVMFPPSRLDSILFNPRERVSLTVRPQIVDQLARQTAVEPTRIVGLGNVLLPGYNATLGLENISGPDAVWNLRYRELTNALKMPYEWNWRMVFDQHHLKTHASALDLLGVGFILSPVKIVDVVGVRHVDNDGRVYAYLRDSAWPRAFYTDRIVTYDTVQALAEYLGKSNGRPFVALERRAIEGTPLLQQTAGKPAFTGNAVVRARNYVLTNNSTSFTIDVPAPGVVYLGETDEPRDFVATMNGESVSYLTANHAFKAIVVDKPGTYRITFRYWPARLSLYLAIAAIGLALWLVILVVYWTHCRRESETATSRGNSDPGRAGNPGNS